MRKIYFAAAAAALGLLCASCQKENCSTAFEGEKSEPVEIAVNIASDEITKAAGTNEKDVTNVQILVFREEAVFAGKREAYVSSTTTSNTIKITSGDRRIYAVVNAPSLSTVTTETELLAAKSKLIDNAEGALVMIGDTGATAVRVSMSNKTFNISVAHICAKIALGSVKVNFEDVAYKDMPFEVTGAYLTNVAGETNYALTADPSDNSFWYNQNTATANPIATAKASLISDSFSGKSASITCGSETAIALNKAYYAYPNAAAAASNTTWAPQQTRLIINVTIGTGAFAYQCCYPVKLCALVANTAYEVTLTVKRPGGDPSTPWEDIVVNDCTVTVTPVDWTTGTPINQTI